MSEAVELIKRVESVADLKGKSFEYLEGFKAGMLYARGVYTRTIEKMSHGA